MIRSINFGGDSYEKLQKIATALKLKSASATITSIINKEFEKYDTDQNGISEQPQEEADKDDHTEGGA